MTPLHVFNRGGHEKNQNDQECLILYSYADFGEGDVKYNVQQSTCMRCINQTHFPVKSVV
jgi:hypothetical protein